MEGSTQAGALDCKESCSPAAAAQRVAADDGDVGWSSLGHAKWPWEAAALQAGLEAALCFPGDEVPTFTQSQVCRHPMRSPCKCHKMCCSAGSGVQGKPLQRQQGGCTLAVALT